MKSNLIVGISNAKLLIDETALSIFTQGLLLFPQARLDTALYLLCSI